MSHFRFLLTLLPLLASFGVQAATNPQVIIKTNVGDMQVELYPQKAPKTVENFIKYVETGFYNDTVFHSTINNFMIQGGGFTPKLEQKPTQAPIPTEATNGLKNEPGTLAMARGIDPNSAKAEFFINLNNNLHLNHFKPETGFYGYCVFGKIVKGMDVANKIGAVPTTTKSPFSGNVPVENIVIQEISLIPATEPQQAESESAPAPAKKPAKNLTQRKRT